MKILPNILVASSLVAICAAELIPHSPVRTGFINDAHAIIGMPLTPMSYAGVARRTAYRHAAVVTTAAVATTAAVTSSAAASQAAAASQSAAASQAAAQSAQASQAAAEQAAATARASTPPPASSGSGPVAIGTVVGQLPGGCVSAPVGGVEYYLCNGTYYRAAFQGNNLVYVVAKP